MYLVQNESVSRSEAGPRLTCACQHGPMHGRMHKRSYLAYGELWPGGHCNYSTCAVATCKLGKLVHAVERCLCLRGGSVACHDALSYLQTRCHTHQAVPLQQQDLTDSLVTKLQVQLTPDACNVAICKNASTLLAYVKTTPTNTPGASAMHQRWQSLALGTATGNVPCSPQA